MKLYIVRHGESETNRTGCWTGWLDVALTDKGIRDAERVRETLAGIKFDKVYSSDLQRARVTAETALPGCTYETTPLLREISLGSLEGTPIKPDWAQTLASRTGGTVPTGGETTEQFRARISEFLRQMQDVPYETVAAFAHGGWLTNALSVIMGVELPRKNIYCGNCATLILEWTGTAWRMTGWINLPEKDPERP